MFVVYHVSGRASETSLGRASKIKYVFEKICSWDDSQIAPRPQNSNITKPTAGCLAAVSGFKKWIEHVVDTFFLKIEKQLMQSQRWEGKNG